MNKDARLATARHAFQHNGPVILPVSEHFLVGVKEEHPLLKVYWVEKPIQLFLRQVIDDDDLIRVCV